MLFRSNKVKLITLSTLEQGNFTLEIEQVAIGDEEKMSVYENWADVIIFQGHALALFEVIKSSSKILISDLYDPMHLEQLEQAKHSPKNVWELAVSDATDLINEQLIRCDFFICASERQRLFWLHQQLSNDFEIGVVR